MGSRPAHQDREYDTGAEQSSDDGTSGGLTMVMLSDASSGVTPGPYRSPPASEILVGQLRAARHDLRSAEITAWSELRGSSRIGTWPWNCSPVEP